MLRRYATILLCASATLGQPARDKLTAYLADLDRLDAQAKAPFDREMARDKAAEKAGDCPQADSTRAIVDCLNNEIGATTANFKAFTGAIRSILALDAPGDHDAAVIGPTGMPLTREARLKQFDDAAAAWENYSQVQMRAARGLWQGGTYAPVAELTCELMLLRSRMRELNVVYDAQLRHH